jgi:hypothetical protein
VNSHSPDSPIRFAVSAPEQQSDVQWWFVGSGLNSVPGRTGSEVELSAGYLEPGYILAGAYVKNEYGLSGLSELVVTVVNTETLGTTAVSDRSLTIHGKVEHPDPASSQTGGIQYVAAIEYRSPSAEEYEVVKTTNSTGTGGTVSTTLTALEPETEYQYRVTLSKVFVDSDTTQRIPVSQSEPALVVTDASSGEGRS